MDTHVELPLEGGLVGYARSVQEALGLRGDSFTVDLGPPAEIYLALEQQLAGWPGWDLALLWTETTGWRLAAESHGQHTLRTVCPLGPERAPVAETLARQLTRALADERSPRAAEAAADTAHGRHTRDPTAAGAVGSPSGA